MTGAPARRPSSPAPTLRAERALLRCGHRLVAGVDEVGRGALAGPVSVGVVVVDETVRTVPAGTRDSKLLRPAARAALVPRIRRWAVASGVGHASPAEIDAVGILAALRLEALGRHLVLHLIHDGADLALIIGRSQHENLGDGEDIGDIDCRDIAS